MDMTPPASSEHRASYRVSYPADYPDELLPVIVIAPDRRVSLVDWSDIGMRVRLACPRDEQTGDHVSVVITLAGREPMQVEGAIVWCDDDTAALRLIPKALPWAILLDEQRAIARWRLKIGDETPA